MFFNKDKEFYRHLFIISFPIVLQSLIASSLNMLDTMMIGKVGEVELASVGIANQFYFLFALLANGFAVGGGVLIAQLYGKKDHLNIKKVLGKALSLSLALTLVFFIVALISPEGIIRLFNTDSLVVEKGSEYLQIVSFSYLFTAITFSFACGLRSIENTRLPMWASFIGLIVNGVLNYILIFGAFGAPVLGVKGAAIATLIARIVECFIIVFFTYWKNEILRVRIHDLFTLPKSFSKVLYIIAIPIVLNEACFGLGTVTYNAIYARIGTSAAAAIQITSTVMNLFMIVTFGLANAAVVIIGNQIGASEEDEAVRSANKISRLSIWISLILAAAMAVLAQPILSFFNVSDAVKTSSQFILYIYAIVMVFKVYNAIMIVGILRGGGDTTYGSILQAFTLWGIGIPITFFAAYYLKLPVHLVVGFTAVEEIVKYFLMRRRFVSRKWIHNMVDHV